MSTTADRYKPFDIELDPADADFSIWTLSKVDPTDSGWWVSSTGSVSCFVPRLADDTPEPRVGDELRVYGSLGFPIQGQVLNGLVLWYRTVEQRIAARAAELVRLDVERRERFERERDQLDAQYEALPAPFKARIDRFRAADPEFRVTSEGYEAGILQQAALLAGHFGSEDAVQEWAAIKPYDEQMAAAPEGWSDGHSGNSYGMSVRFALALLRGEQV